MPQITLNSKHRMHKQPLQPLRQYSDTSSSKASFNSDSSSIISSQSSIGWGSVESRQSYMCLSALVDVQTPAKREIRQEPINGDTWGYFADTQ